MAAFLQPLLPEQQVPEQMFSLPAVLYLNTQLA
jgi:hypothetical protein